MILLSVTLFLIANILSGDNVYAKTNLSEKWNSQKQLSKTDQRKLWNRYNMSGASAIHYAHKNLYKGLFKERYSFKFEPNSYAWKDLDYLKYDVSLKSNKKVKIKKVKIKVGGKSKSINLHYVFYLDGFTIAEAGKNNAMQKFLTKNIRMSKKATVTFYTNKGKITKTLNRNQKEAILDNITLHTKLLH